MMIFTLIVVIKMCLLNMKFLTIIESTTPESNVMESLLPIIMLGVFSEAGCKGLSGVLPNPMGRGFTIPWYIMGWCIGEC
jgi:hypothetical protein